MTAPLPAWVAFRYRDFAFFCAARFISAVAIQIQSVGVGWLVYDITRSPLSLGLVGLAEFLPAVSLALLTGHVADQHDRRAILAVCYFITTLSSLGLLACAWFEIREVSWIYALILVFGVTRAFANPANQALLPNTVPREHLGNAIAWNSTAWQIATILGPAIGGVLYLIGDRVVFAAAAVAFAASLALYGAIHVRPAAPGRVDINWGRVLAGIHFIRSRPVVLGAISLDLFAVLLGGATALLPVYARDILVVGPWGLGLLRTMPAVGALVTALWLTYRPLTRRTGRRMFQAVAIFGVATIGFGVSRNLALSMGCLAILGAADMVSVFIRQTLVQIETPDEMRGRVSAVNSVFIGASNELGEFESGIVAAAIGTVASVVVGGIGTLLVAALWAWWFPALRERDRLLT